ncbi:MarR family winged helix-turn-helix transcriptional regulator [Streptomyces iconiensis]|uniref:MarR family transcriptional regulator n=1 Tax=Streptomyces iconiensis TaxID=1384038 RepID=A0ABT6ZNT0_9ACTN|nr:MarR family transcriptional regulator [Streptomyces iconiensis]MDJ1130711.1 MarR family transcriptional regulator [Streptomyces iconiensis]
MDDARVNLELIDSLFVLRDRIQGELKTLLRGLELTDAQADALWRLSGEKEMTARRLAERLHCDASSATSMIDRLEKQGLVHRVPHPTDRRVKVLQLTPEGCALRERLIRHAVEQSPFARLDSDSRLRLHALLREAAGEDPAGTRGDDGGHDAGEGKA